MTTPETPWACQAAICPRSGSRLETVVLARFGAARAAATVASSGGGTALSSQRPQGGRRAPPHETALGNIAVGIALTHAHQGLSVVVHFELPPAHQPSSKNRRG